MQSIADIIPNAIRRGGLGRKLREQEILEAFELAANRFVPADLRSYVRGMYVRGTILTVASLSGTATTIMKQKEKEILAYIKEIDSRIKIEKVRILA
jgi:hypothetical protein